MLLQLFFSVITKLTNTFIPNKRLAKATDVGNLAPDFSKI